MTHRQQLLCGIVVYLWMALTALHVLSLLEPSADGWPAFWAFAGVSALATLLLARTGPFESVWFWLALFVPMLAGGLLSLQGGAPLVVAGALLGALVGTMHLAGMLVGWGGE